MKEQVEVVALLPNVPLFPQVVTHNQGDFFAILLDTLEETELKAREEASPDETFPLQTPSPALFSPPPAIRFAQVETQVSFPLEQALPQPALPKSPVQVKAEQMQELLQVNNLLPAERPLVDNAEPSGVEPLRIFSPELTLKNLPTEISHIPEEDFFSEEKKGEQVKESLTPHLPPYRQEEKVDFQKSPQVEAVRRFPDTRQEAKHVRVQMEEATIRLTLAGDRLRLSINMDKELYRLPTAFEVQRLVQSLQTMGFNLEVLKLNGNSLYGSDHRSGSRREEGDREGRSPSEEVYGLSSDVKGSFSLYL